MDLLINTIPNIYHFYNEWHYGDNILNLKFLNNIREYLDKEDITIYYYYNENYIKNIKELTKYIHTNRIKLDTISKKQINSINLCMDNFIMLHNISYNTNTGDNYITYEHYIIDDKNNLYILKSGQLVPNKINGLISKYPDLLVSDLIIHKFNGNVKAIGYILY